MVIIDAFTHYVAHNPVPRCNAYYAYTTLCEHWIAKLGLPEILVTDNGTEFINNETITLCYLYNIKHKPRTSHAPWTYGLVEGLNRSLQEHLRCIINGNDTKDTEGSTDEKLFPLAYISQVTTTLGLSPYELVFNQKPRKQIMFTANSSKNAQGYCQPANESISQTTTTLGLSPYEMVFHQKPRKPIMFTENSSKNAQGFCQPTKESSVIINHYIQSHIIDIVDQTVKTIDIKIIIQDQIQIEATNRTSLKTIPFQTLVIETIQTIDPETPHTKETEIIQIIETDSIKLTDHETIQTTDQTTIDQITITITIDHVTIPKI